MKRYEDLDFTDDFMRQGTNGHKSNACMGFGVYGDRKNMSK